MNKRGKLLSALFTILLFAALGVSLYYVYEYWPRDPVSFEEFTAEEQEQIVENLGPSKQFYPNMRYQYKEITYSIASACSDERADSMREAFEDVARSTVLTFIELESGDAMIKVLCSEIAPETGQENYFVAGEGGPSRVINSTLYAVILEGKVALYRDDQCPGAKVATHELLHALGFDHNNNPESLLYPTLRCNQEVDSSIYSAIDDLYADQPLPDLVFFTASATKKGRYLDFHVEIINQGLTESDPVSISVYSGDKLAETFETGAISIGARKILDVENLRLPNDAATVRFVVDEEDSINELYENNNAAVLHLSEQ